MLWMIPHVPSDRRAEMGLELVAALSERGLTACSLDGAGEDRIEFYRSLAEVYRDAGEEHFVIAPPDSLDPATLGFWLRARARESCYQIDVDFTQPGLELTRSLEQFDADASQLELPLLLPPAPELRTSRLRLGWPTHAQLSQYFDAIHGTSIFDTIIWDGPDSPEDLEDSYLRFRQQALSGPRSTLAVAVFESAPPTGDPSTERMIGGVSWRPYSSDPSTGDIGYAFAESAHGQGYATEAVREIIRFAFEEREAVRIEAQVFVGNVASRRVLEKNGFLFESTLEAAVPKRGQRIDEWAFAITRDRWSSR